MLKLGSLAPDISIQTDYGWFDLTEQIGKKVVVFFFPRADHETDLCEQFGVCVKKSMYGKNFMGVQRTSFIIDIDRKIIKIWPKVKVEGHAQDVLTSVKALRA